MGKDIGIELTLDFLFLWSLCFRTTTQIRFQTGRPSFGSFLAFYCAPHSLWRSTSLGCWRIQSNEQRWEIRTRLESSVSKLRSSAFSSMLLFSFNIFRTIWNRGYIEYRVHLFAEYISLLHHCHSHQTTFSVFLKLFLLPLVSFLFQIPLLSLPWGHSSVWDDCTLDSGNWDYPQFLYSRNRSNYALQIN